MNKIIVENIMQSSDKFSAKVEGSIDHEIASSLKASNRMLVDSDSLAFIYILESETEYYYVVFPQATWSDLHAISMKSSKLELDLNNGVLIELTAICDELSYLTENIAGNSNYGEKMEQAVEKVFGQHT